MVRKLAALVLCLFVLVPQRICTCAAASAPCSHSDRQPCESDRQANEECDHQDLHTDHRDDTDHPAGEPDHLHSPRPVDHDRHDPGCPQEKPGPTWEAVKSIGSTAPQPDSNPLLTTVEPPALLSTAGRDRLPPLCHSHVPRYLALLSLRI